VTRKGEISELDERLTAKTVIKPGEFSIEIPGQISAEIDSGPHRPPENDRSPRESLRLACVARRPYCLRTNDRAELLKRLSRARGEISYGP
jgi:hypothetical protein